MSRSAATRRRTGAGRDRRPPKLRAEFSPGQEAVPLEDAAQRFDSAYRVLLSAPPDDMSTPAAGRVIERHSAPLANAGSDTSSWSIAAASCRC